ncbi:MAG: 2-oxoacid:acceptor oxidoreductase family protein [Spirochaetota bacterium]|jgi:2-oxoglutarate ferredoxin oxidoreductase subunit gamma|nr:2-oxoacid:acceptor oxidoreductase family protein [Spirochaetota bacterium]NMA56355.1 2-oxoacid:ferredoxin oxidoreductase subunit gamma [Treponema sp.]HPY52613.1 2-oxoacid:acceptor oxidoreductase family protein [Treponemataceae bacterium]
MTKEIIFAGFGGQGVILAGKVLCLACMSDGKSVSHIPAYGAEMRGGTANCSVIISDEDIASPVIDKSDIVIALNKPSMVKFEKSLKENGLLIYNTSLIDSKPSRTDIKTLGIPVNAMAEESGNPRGINMVVLGVLAKLFPEMLSKHAHFTAALDQAISERNKKFNPLNIATIESAYAKDYVLE